jgi:thiosulfate/3-mercaptopyruvate sulfurtransferase
VKRLFSMLLVTVLSISTLAGCASYDFGETDGFIVTAEEAVTMMESGAILVDASGADEYASNHIEGAINIPMSNLVTTVEDVPGMLVEKEEIERCLSEAGVTENDTLIIYDNASNMKAARIQWSLNYYGNFNVYVVSGGLTSLEKEGLTLTTNPTTLTASTYKTGAVQKKLLVSLAYLQNLIDMPEENTYIIDTRSDEEYYAGSIPGSIHIEYVWNNYGNGEYKTARDIQLTYLDKGIMPDAKIVLYCKSSVRATQAYTALRNAGYTDVRIYDGAWLEYELVNGPQAPVENVTPTDSNGS